MRATIAILVTTICGALITSCGDDGDGNISGADEEWCREYEVFVIELDRIIVGPSTPPDPTSEEVQALNQMGEAFLELPVPAPIRSDFDVAQPRTMARPESVEQVRARLRVAEWVSDHCAVGKEFGQIVRQQIADDRAELAALSPSTTT